MKIRRTTMAVAAAGALALTACTSDSGGGDDADGGSGSGSDTTQDSSASASPMAGQTEKLDLGNVSTKADEITFSLGEVEWQAYNSDSSATNSTYNAIVNDRLQEAFVYFGTDGTIYPNEDFGTFEVVSEDPLTVEYTIGEDTVWEDGTPVTINDFLLLWASSNPETLFPEGGPFDAVSDSFGKYVPEGPQGEVGGKTFTVSYPDPYPDWKLIVDSPLPAHVVAEQAGMEPDELAQKFMDRDTEGLDEAAEFWNTGWIFDGGELPDPSLVPSSGPYSLDGATWKSPEYLTLVPNENYYGPAPATENLTFRFAAPETQVQALQNGDINIIEPQPTVDTVAQVEALGDDFTLLTGPTLTWEHLDFNFVDSSVFSDEKGGLAAREAFAMCVPRQQIIDSLIKPIQEDAVIMNAREVFPFQDDYEETVSAAYDGRYDEVDLEGAQAKLEEAGLSTPVDVQIGYSAPNERRTNEVASIKASCDQAGFNIIDGGDPQFFAAGGPLEIGDFDVALFAWAGSGQIASGEPIYSTGGGQNFGKYSNEDVDTAFETLSTSDDPEVWKEQRIEAERLLWDTLYGIPLFSHPGVVAYDSTIDNVIFNSTQTATSWNAEQWVRSE